MSYINQINFYTATLAQSLTAGGAETEIFVSSIKGRDGVALSTSDFSALGKGWITVDPQSSQRAERISFTTVNATDTSFTGAVRGLSNIGGSGSASANAFYHPVGSPVVISFGADDYAALLDFIASTSYAGTVNASTSQKGIVELATQAEMDARTTTGGTGALLVPTPDIVRSTLVSDYAADTGTANVYAIAPTPAITAYTTGQLFAFKAAHANTTTSTLAVSGLTAKNIYRIYNGTVAALSGGEILANQLVVVMYDGAEFQIVSPLGSINTINNNTVPFGDGSDGAVTISGDTTLTRDMYYTDLTVNITKTLSTANFRVFVSGTLTVNGTIANNGNAGTIGGAGTSAAPGVGGTGGAGGTATGAGSLAANIAGAAGGNGGAGGTDSGIATNGGGGGGGSGASGGILAIYARIIIIGASGALQSLGGAGGAGGAGASGDGGAGGSNTAGGNASNGNNGVSATVSVGVSATAQSGTSGNGGVGATQGGAGGSAGTAGSTRGTVTATTSLPHSVVGGTMLLELSTGSPMKSSASSVSGGGGGGGGKSTTHTGGGGGGGGGYGGSGGAIVLVYSSLTNGGSIAVTGGAGGAKGSGGALFSAGTDGVAGLAGATGVIFQIVV